MTAQSVACPPESALSDFGLGKLDVASTETISQHLETCPDCRQRVASLSGDSFVGKLQQAGAGARRDGTLPVESLDDASHVGPPPELASHPEYELVKELGQGGMGTVYLAKNRTMDRLEVLKVISRSLLDHPGALERFQQEIRSAARLAHPNIVTAYSVVRPGNLLVFAMEHVRGQDLSQVVKQRGPLPVANAAFYVHQVANGLQHAFERGMVHRDIKPSNLMLAIEGKKHLVKILDFGLAKATSEKGAERGLTKSGQMLGTPDYVAPEQTVAAHKADIRADIYSLGCTFYFLLSGGAPFQEQSLFEILQAHHTRDPKPLNVLRRDVPAELAAVVAKMMAKDPARRYQTPVEVARDLVPFFKAGQNAATPANSTQPRTVAEPVQSPGAATPDLPIAPAPLLYASAFDLREDLHGRQAPGEALVDQSANDPFEKLAVVAATPAIDRKASPRRSLGLSVGCGLLTLSVTATAAVLAFFLVDRPDVRVAQVGAQSSQSRQPRKAPASRSPKVPKPEADQNSTRGIGESVREPLPPPERSPAAKVDKAPPPDAPAAPRVSLAPLVEPKTETPSPGTGSTESGEDAKPAGSAMQKGGNPRGRKGTPAPGSTWYLCELPLQAYFVFVPEKIVIPGIVPGLKFPSGAALSLKGDPTPHGLYTPPPANGFSFLNFRLAGKAKSISFEVGLDEGSPRVIATKPVFQVWGDNKLLWASSAITGTEHTEKCENLNVEGIKILVLRVNCPGKREGVEPVWYEPTVTWK